MAHSDQPLKEGNVHISAPHIYASAIEALDLTPNSSISFLNVGSGTGYISCIAAAILGPNSLNYGKWSLACSFGTQACSYFQLHTFSMYNSNQVLSSMGIALNIARHQLPGGRPQRWKRGTKSPSFTFLITLLISKLSKAMASTY